MYFSRIKGVFVVFASFMCVCLLTIALPGKVLASVQQGKTEVAHNVVKIQTVGQSTGSTAKPKDVELLALTDCLRKYSVTISRDTVYKASPPGGQVYWRVDLDINAYSCSSLVESGTVTIYVNSTCYRGGKSDPLPYRSNLNPGNLTKYTIFGYSWCVITQGGVPVASEVPTTITLSIYSNAELVNGDSAFLPAATHRVL